MASNDLASSPLTPPPSSHSQSQPISTKPSRQCRKVRALPFELAQHVQTYFEEALFTQGFNFLLSIASSGASGSASHPVTIPSPEYFGVAATIAVHPSFTTRTQAQDKHEQANAALRLLRLVNDVVGSENARFGLAFEFRRYDTRSAGRNEKFEEDSQESFFNQKLSIKYADDESIFASAEDFWAVVGWALNCSCLSNMYAQRWDWWHVWLQFMLDVLHQDWFLNKEKPHDLCYNSLLWRYIESSSGGGANGRRIFRAIFADGSVQSLNEFREVFRKELKEPKNDDDKLKKREVDVNVDEEIFGDYLEQEESDYSSDNSNGSERKRTTAHENLLIAANSLQPRPAKRLRMRTPTGRAKMKNGHETPVPSLNDDDINKLGSPESIRIRLRLLTLLLEVSSHPTLLRTPKYKYLFPDLHDLYTLLVEFIKPLPLPVFQQFILPSIHIHTSPALQTNAIFSINTLIILQEFLIQRIIESAAPSISATQIIGDSLSDQSARPLTQELLVTHYLPFAAAAAGNGPSGSGDRSNKSRGGAGIIDAQARLSLLLEGMLRALAAQGTLSDADHGLSAALDHGIQKRLKKARTIDRRGRKKDAAEDSGTEERADDEVDVAMQTLLESGERMRAVVARVA